MNITDIGLFLCVITSLHCVRVCVRRQPWHILSLRFLALWLEVASDICKYGIYINIPLVAMD